MTQTPANPWWTYPRIDNIGQPDPDGGFPKPDSNILVPDGTNMTAPASGTITDINTNTTQYPYGEVITVQFDNPPSNFITHYAFLHLASIPSTLAVGQHVNAGDTLGISGANPQNAAPGFALYLGNAYGQGIDWSTYDTQAMVTGPFNPVPYLDALKNNTNPNSPYQGNGPSLGDALGAIGGFFATIGPWVSNPTRLLKLLIGATLLIGSIFILAQPESQLALGVSHAVNAPGTHMQKVSNL